MYYIYIYIHTHTHTHIYTHIHTYIYIYIIIAIQKSSNTMLSLSEVLESPGDPLLKADQLCPAQVGDPDDQAGL